MVIVLVLSFEIFESLPHQVRTFSKRPLGKKPGDGAQTGSLIIAMTAAAVKEHCNFSFTMVIAWGMGRLWGLEQQRSYLVSHI